MEERLENRTEHNKKHKIVNLDSRRVNHLAHCSLGGQQLIDFFMVLH